MEESPWGDLRGKPLDSRGLSRRLAKYGVKPKTVRIGVVTAKGYSRQDFHDPWSRYCHSVVTDVTHVTATTEPNGADVTAGTLFSIGVRNEIGVADKEKDGPPVSPDLSVTSVTTSHSLLDPPPDDSVFEDDGQW